MSLRLRVLLSLLAVVVVMAVPALFAAERVTQLRDIVLELRGQAAQSAFAVGRLEAALAQLDHTQRVCVAAGEQDAAALMHASVRDIAAAIATLRVNGYGDLVARSGIELAEVRATAAHLDSLVARRALEEATSYLLAHAAPLVENARAAVPGLVAAIDLETGARVPLAQNSAAAAATATTAAVLVGLALAILLAFAAARVLIAPLAQLRLAMARVAQGTFETPADLPYEQADEVGDLSRSFHTMTRRLAELDRLKAEFVGAASHDLKTPISVIAGYIELMQDELGATLDGRQDEMLESLAEQTRILQRRVDQMLEMSRMESGRLELALEDLDLRHFMAEVHRQFQPLASARDIRLELVVHDRTPECILADPDVLRTDVIGNLMSNALAHTPPGGAIRMSLQAGDDDVSLEIADTGTGMPQEQIERIFSRYYQSCGATRTGLGLAIARAGVENHGGRIDVQSRVGKGTSFRVRLPLRPAAAPVTGPRLLVPA